MNANTYIQIIADKYTENVVRMLTLVGYKHFISLHRDNFRSGHVKVMFGCSTTDRVEEQGKWPCGVCKKGVGSNSILSLIHI